MADHQIEVAGHLVKVTNLDKVLYPATGTTKAEVIAYYQAVAQWLVPHAADRPATRKRWPEGVGTAEEFREPFFHKGLPVNTIPDWVATHTIAHSSSDKAYPLVNNAATLVWLAQQAALEIHVPQYRVHDGEPQHPDRLVLDLDPGPGVGLDTCVAIAQLLRVVLDEVGFASVPVTSGSKGIHIYAGLHGAMTSDEASDFAHELARGFEASHPDLVVSDMRKTLRDGKVLLDWSQNSASKTTVAPYSLRGRSTPTVAAPRSWDEIAPGLTQLEFDQVLERLSAGEEPLAVLLPGSDKRE